ncbi:hypothetical protein [Sphingobacterium faecium]|uniref:hypothetical protein n=1 Tax=Sphingobacterium faecium TaxID=34087 RepID=UPI00097F0296|nr:hypothetical protein [Sphingobacterium faecium]SJN45736.1 hypothetical protein FM120_16935 [Sphingobacterium faecium PCAi_F2.5]HCU46050.1 hypothetical protein [Sphingobacterium sp.]MQP27919.1 hypothetical protein [Sphingobacterium faecium]PTX11844.1 hypothetical protein C8N37_103421 [Sphingobacterium faecium]WGQ13794.1 hypothetical protein QG727_17390 [Sphingobacterium faecium]
MAWFIFTGTDPSQSSHYTLSPGTTPPSCPGAPEALCSIQDMNDGFNNPKLESAIQAEIANALQNEVNTTNVRLKARPTSK